MLRGGVVSREPLLIINKPARVDDSEDGIQKVGYTVTQPFTNEEEKDPRSVYEGSKLENRYVEEIPPEEDTVNLEWMVEFPVAGSYFIQFSYSIDGSRPFTSPFYINVEPVLLVRDEEIRVKELSIITVISRCLGPIETSWEGMYDNMSQLGYNAIHFTPIQKYGMSNSHYSIADQTTVDEYFYSDKTLPREERIGQLKEKVDYLKEEYRMLGIVDIVLNHTANNSAWLLEHP